jgi:hypothetical protein
MSEKQVPQVINQAVENTIQTQLESQNARYQNESFEIEKPIMI